MLEEQPAVPTGGILTLDPGGKDAKTVAKGAKKGNTGYFYYVNPTIYEIGTIDGENSVEHGKKIDLLIKKFKPVRVGWETSQNIRVRFLNENYIQLLYLNGIIPYILSMNHYNPTHTHKIYNLEVDKALNSERISGLELKLVQGQGSGRPKNTFFFQSKPIGIHEADAIGVFYVLWTKILKSPWIWKN